jgi:hypothetical protein
MKSYNKGITIIEVVVSMIITGSVLVGMLHLYSVGAIQSNIVRHKVMAVNITQAEIEGLINKGYETIDSEVKKGTIYPKTQDVKIDTGKTGNASDDINGTMITNISKVNEIYKVTVNISWSDYYGTVNEVLESTIASYL